VTPPDAPEAERLRSLLDVSERERQALSQTIEDVLSFQRLAEMVGESRDPETLVEELATMLGRVVPWSGASVRLGDGNCPCREVFSRGMGPRAVQRFAELEEEALVKWVMASRRPSLIPPLDGPDGVGWILVPLVVQNRTVGLVSLIPSLPCDQVTGHQMEMLRLMATQAAAALDNLGHMEDVRRNWNELHSMYQVAATLGQSLDVERLFEIAARAIRKRHATKGVAMAFVDPVGGGIRTFASGMDPVASRTLLDLGLASRETLLLDRNLSHGAELAGLDATDAVVFPLVSGGRHLGAFLVVHGALSLEESRRAREWYEAVSRLLCASLENARLYEELMVSNRRMSDLQNRMIQAGRLSGIGQLAGGIAHEINNPLQVILGRIQILQVRSEGQPIVLADLQRLETETMRIAQIVRGMQDFARQQPVEATRYPVKLSTIVEAVLELIGFRLKRHRIEVVRTGFATSPVVEGDADELKHLVLNLCLNSLQAMPDGGALNLEVAERAGQAVLEVSDTGPGIPAEDLERIFDPFFTRRAEGMGMGLAIGYSIAQRHGGSIHAVPGISLGAKLRVVLPLYVQ
jgi:signal transduction histidine kinase